MKGDLFYRGDRDGTRPKSEVRSQKAEVGSRKSEVGSKKLLGHAPFAFRLAFRFASHQSPVTLSASDGTVSGPKC